jgi:predicted peptidase
MKNFTYLFRKVLSIIPIFLIFCSTALGQQVPRGLTASNNVFIGFYEYKPTDYSANPNEKYPMIIFLHGIGERGNGTSELPMVLGQGIPKYINAGHPMRFFWNGKWETFLVLSPQLSRNYGDWQNFYVDEMLNYAKNNLRVDTNRIYLTGLSLGDMLPHR